jgi:3-deoxy-D-manno-octulosonic-acid transferase
MELGIKPKDPVLVIGSSHNPEELQLLEVLEEVWKAFPDLKVLFVPRHPERFNEVASILQKHSITFRRLSQKGHAHTSAPVILIDAMGLLRKCYQLADIAIVAGSYTVKVGGHNVLEPSWYGVPVVFGPYMHSQPDLVDLMKEYGAGIQVSMEDLQSELIGLLLDSSRRKTLGEAGLRLSSDVHGATGKTCALIKKHVFQGKEKEKRRK